MICLDLVRCAIYSLFAVLTCRLAIVTHASSDYIFRQGQTAYIAQVVTLHDSVSSKQNAVDALDKLQREEETLRSIAAGYVLPADATAEARAQRKAALDRLRENVRRAHGLYIREITVVRYDLSLF